MPPVLARWEQVNGPERRATNELLAKSGARPLP